MLFGPSEKETLLAEYNRLINQTLPAAFTHPVRFNHCFARIVLDWTFGDCWYRHLNKSTPACHQLSEARLQAAVGRMQTWLQHPETLAADNEASLRYRNKVLPR